jgi:hypothetical protein
MLLGGMKEIFMPFVPKAKNIFYRNIQANSGLKLNVIMAQFLL